MLFHRLEPAADRDVVASDAEMPGQLDRVVDAALGREGPGHGHTKHVVPAQGRDGQGGGDRRIDAAAQADDNLVETTFAEVVAEPEDKGIVYVGHVGVSGGIDRNRGRNGGECVDFAEAGQFGRKVAVGREGERVSVEDKLVIAADQIGVNQGHLEPPGDGAEHGASFDRLASLKRGSAQVEQEVDAGPGQFVERTASVKITGQILRGPEVFADRDTGPPSCNVGDGHLGGGFKVAALVEDVISRQERFVRGGQAASVLQDHRAVVAGATVGRGVRFDRADDERDGTGFGRQRFNLTLGCCNEARTKDEVHRRVAADREFRGDDKISPGCHQFPVGAEDFGGIAVKIPDRRVDLGEAGVQGS